MKVYMQVTDDEFELPVAVADSSGELAKIVGVSRNSILSAISHVKAGRKKKSRYVSVEVDEE